MIKIEDIKEKTDLELVEKVKNEGCDDSIRELMDRHSLLFHKIVNRFSRNSDCNLEKELHEDKSYVFFDAALKFDPSKNVKFSSFLGNMARYKCLTETQNLSEKKKKEAPRYATFEGAELDIFDMIPCENTDSTERLKELENYLNRIIDSYPKEETKKIVRERFFSKTKKVPMVEIAKKRGVSTQAIAFELNKFFKFARKSIEKEKKVDSL